MARLARVVAPGLPHYVSHRGNRRMDTFFGEDDYRAYLALMAEWCGKKDVEIWAYCLLPSEVRLILTPASAEGLCRAVGEAHRRYTRRVNERQGWRGHLWEGRFASFVMDEPYVLAAARHVEMGAVSAGLARRPGEWPWSSAADHISGRSDGPAGSQWLAEHTAGWVSGWREFLRRPPQPGFVASLGSHESTGRPMGDKAFVQRLEAQLGRRLQPGKAGRPRKNKDD